MFDENDLTVGPLAGEQFALPQREGPVDLGKAQEFAMSHVGIGDYGNIRTIEFVQPDGTIARLRTRGGYPVFETDAPTPVTSTARGFVAKVPAGRAVLFNPYTLTVLNSDYKPAGKHYTVQDFATTWGVPAGDTTHWHDVVLADGSVKINAKTYSPFGSFGTLSETAIPHIINRADDYDQYGNVELNLTQKRYFEVERESVKTWGGAGSVSLLTPQAPITDSIRRAMTVGPSVDFPTDTATLGEFYSSSLPWDAYYSEWYISSASVSLLLTPLYLSKVSDTATPTISVVPIAFVGGTTSGTSAEDFALQETDLFPVGVGEITSTSYPAQVKVEWPWREIYSAPLIGENTFSYTDSRASASISENCDQFGYAVSVYMLNEKLFSHRSKRPRVKDQYVPLPSDGTHNSFGETQYYNSTDGYYWALHHDPTPPGPRGPATAHLQGDSIPIDVFDATEAVYDYELQNGQFHVDAGASAGRIVDCTFSVTHYRGEDFEIYNNGVDFSSYMSAPFTDLTVYDSLPISNDAGMTTPQKEGGWSNIESLGGSWVGTKTYRLADEKFNDAYLSMFINYYTGHHLYDVVKLSEQLQWSTKDYLLFDEPNGVFISVEGVFSGEQVDSSPATATLQVMLKVKTRHHTTTQTLETFSFGYVSLLPEKDISGTGSVAVPSPQIRAIFTPLYREQGSFKGAHYVTAAEELAGAAPFHGFNFILRLTGYDTVGSVNALNKEATVYLVPCNLLEMLYATVFSSEFGVSDDGSRYPVTRLSSYNTVMSSLFTNAYRVAVRDGVAGNWTDAFGTDFAETSTISLHRT